jgi:hypothetical protein
MASLGTAAGVTAATATAATTVFQYNRKNYMYDREMRLETEYQIMEFRIERAKLFRDDVRDIIGLTSVKMDTYLIINAVQLGFCIMMFCEGRLAAGTPNWLLGAHTLALSAAFTYLLMSVWLSMHAMIAAKSYEVRLLTQLVRLPIPSWEQLEGARTYASTFEKVEARQMFRVPFVMGTQEGVLGRAHRGSIPPAQSPPEIADASAASATPEASQPDSAQTFSADPWGLERPGDQIYELDGAVQTDPRNLQHVRLVREALQYFQSYDAFARVSMSVGTNQLITALSYYVLGYVLISNHAIIASWLAVVLFMAIACALIRLDMSLTAWEYRGCVFLVVCGPVSLAICSRDWALHGTDLLVKILVPIAYLSQTLWLSFIINITNVKEFKVSSRSNANEEESGVRLPTGFRSVLYIDVFGWIKDNAVNRVFRGLEANNGGRARSGSFSRQFSYGATDDIGTMDPPQRTNGAGPGVSNVQYQGGRPQPIRVEQQPGAARPSFDASVKPAHFAPASFVPREMDSEEQEEEDALEASKAASRPWLVFCGATTLLAGLWLLSGVFITMEVYGWRNLRVHPLLKESGEAGTVEKPGNHSLLQSGSLVQTSWPHENVHTFGLACDSASDTVLASSRFGLYTASLNDFLNQESHRKILQFKTAPSCPDIEGEALQDVALHCDTSRREDSCHAVVLHENGRRLARCGLTGPLRRSTHQDAKSSISFLSEDWLKEGDAKTDAEHVQSLAILPHCASHVDGCAYVGTSTSGSDPGRVVELQQTIEHGAEHNLFPRHLLNAGFNGTAGGSMSIINDRYLALLEQNGRDVKVLDLQRRGAVVNTWSLPDAASTQTWTAMCAMGKHLYFFGKGPSPQLWQFEMPLELQQQAEKQMAVTGEGAEKIRGLATSPTHEQSADMLPRYQTLIYQPSGRVGGRPASSRNGLNSQPSLRTPINLRTPKDSSALRR